MKIILFGSLCVRKFYDKVAIVFVAHLEEKIITKTAMLINLYEDLGIEDSAAAKGTNCTNVVEVYVLSGLRDFPVRHGGNFSAQFIPAMWGTVHSKDGTAIFNS